MTLSLKNDTSHPGGGFALLDGVDVAGVTSITIENGFSSQFLGEDGKWGRNPFGFPVEETVPGTLLLGPHIVDHVPTELQIELRSGDGRMLGKLFWADVIPSRNPGSVTSAQVLEDRRRRAEQRATEEQAALERLVAQKAEDHAAREKTAAEAAARLAALEAAAVAAAEAERRRVADKERQRTAALATATIVAKPDPVIKPAPKRRARWPRVLALLLLPLAAAAAIMAARPDLLDTLRHDVSPAMPDPGPVAQTPPPATPRAEPPEAPELAAPPRADCSSFAVRLADIQGRSDANKVALGEEALHAGCGSEAFQAFDLVPDPKANEAAAWNLARFYDPNENDPVYRRAASVHPDFAAAYYKMWRDRSPRQAAALAKICATETGGGASLRQSCGR